MIQYLYTLFISLLLAVLVGTGISAFHPGPEMPDYPAFTPSSNGELTVEQREKEEQYQEEQKGYQERLSAYNRDVSVVSLIAAIIILLASLIFLNKIKILSDGLLLGGIFTLIYSIIRGFGTDDNKYRFIVVAVGFVLAMILGYMKFVKTDSKSNTKAKKNKKSS
jgi:D-alanyl-lipoteichoic acid acyltransferase DltB (MBOAT superfamily)